MTRYLISFDDGAMTFPDEDQHAVAEAAHQVVKQDKDAGVRVTGGRVIGYEVSVVGTRGSVTAGPSSKDKQCIGGCSIVDVPSYEEALEWAAKIAVACRCSRVPPARPSEAAVCRSMVARE